MANCTVMMTVKSDAKVTKYECETRQGRLLSCYAFNLIARQNIDIGQFSKNPEPWCFFVCFFFVVLLLLFFYIRFRHFYNNLFIYLDVATVVWLNYLKVI